MWVYVSSIDDWAEFILNQKDDQDVGYMLEVDLEYPEDLHYKHDTYPCAPEKIKIKEEYLSEYQKELGRGCGVKFCLLYTSPSPRNAHESRMPSSA